MRIEGSVQGDVAITGKAEIAAGAAVEGELSAGSLDLGGKLDGDANCQGPITVRSGASVKGDLTGTSVTIEPGSVIDVRLDTDFTLDFASTGRRR